MVQLRRGLTNRRVSGLRKGAVARVRAKRTGKILQESLEPEEEQLTIKDLSVFRCVQGKAYHTPHRGDGYAIYVWTDIVAPTEDHYGVETLHSHLRGVVEELSSKIEEGWKDRRGSYYYGQETTFKQTATREQRRQVLKSKQEVYWYRPFKTATVFYEGNLVDESTEIPDHIRELSMG